MSCVFNPANSGSETSLSEILISGSFVANQDISRDKIEAAYGAVILTENL